MPDVTAIRSATRAFLDLKDPVAGLERAGVSTTRKRTTSTATTSVGPLSKSTTTYGCTQTWKLPEPSPVSFSLVQEGLRHKVVKLFSRELQTGDDAFDQLVYITTDSPELAAALLSIETVRAAAAEFVSGGGEVHVEGDVVTIKAVDEIDPEVVPEPGRASLLVAYVLGLAEAAKSG